MSGISRQNGKHDEFTKEVKDKVTILGAVFSRDKGQETFENLQKATKTLKKLQNSTGKFVSLVGKILQHGMAWLIDIKNYHFRPFIAQIEKYLCEFKRKEILEKVSKRREEGRLGLINVKERIQAIQALEFLKAYMQKPETDNLLFEVGWRQKALYGRVCLFCLCILHQSCLTITAGTANCPVLGVLDSSLHLLWRELGSLTCLRVTFSRTRNLHL